MNSHPHPEPPAALLVDKSAGPTSHDLVQQIKREYGVKAGHAGTLDPFATGLMICLLGRATRLQRYLMGLPKRYLATARLGWRSSTGDPTGELIRTNRFPDSLELPTGTVRQQLPMTSAVRVDGERLYKRAHRGEEIETPVREAEVYRAELLAHDSEHAQYDIECGAGTYVRTLIETLEDAYCDELRRTAIGDFSVPEGDPVALSAGELLSFMPERKADEREASLIGHGTEIGLGDLDPDLIGESGSDRVRVTSGRTVVAVARVADGTSLKPEVVLA